MTCLAPIETLLSVRFENASKGVKGGVRPGRAEVGWGDLKGPLAWLWRSNL